MSRVSNWCGVFLAIAFVLSAGRSAADTHSGSSERAFITLIGDAARNPELRGVLSELLERDNIEAIFAERPRFGSSELLDTTAREATVGVFVVPRGLDAARVYFRAPDGERFLVRDVALSSGFDALGRELIAQIVEASVVALLRSDVGIRRVEVKAELDSSAIDVDRDEPDTPKSTPAPNPAREPGRSPQTGPRKSALLEGWCAARYAAEWSGRALGIGHGPGLELGIAVRWRLVLRARLILERDFPRDLHAGPIDARVTTSRWRTGLDVGPALGENSAVLLSLGVGQDASRIEPTASRDASVLPAATSQEAPTVAHSELRLEAGTAQLQFALAAALDIPLVRTPYDIDRGPNAKQVAAPWPVRPGAALSLAWRPQFGWF